MKILSFDSSRNKPSMTVYDSEAQKTIITKSFTEKSSQLIALIHDAFLENKLSIRDISLILISLGPGSFTGIRASLVIAKTLAAELNIKVFAVNNFQLARFLRMDEGPVAIFAGKSDYFISPDQSLANNFYNTELKDKSILYEFIEENLSKSILDFYLQADDRDKLLLDEKELKPYYLREPSINLAKAK